MKLKNLVLILTSVFCGTAVMAHRSSAFSEPVFTLTEDGDCNGYLHEAGKPLITLPLTKTSGDDPHETRFEAKGRGFEFKIQGVSNAIIASILDRRTSVRVEGGEPASDGFHEAGVLLEQKNRPRAWVGCQLDVTTDGEPE